MMPWKSALLLALTAISPASAASDPAPERVEIVLSNFAFTPSTIHLSPGRPYLLHFVNRGSGGHNFAAKDFFAAARITGDVPPGGVVELGKGESRDVALVPAAGRYKVKCTHFFHSGLGMKGKVIVE
jgi:plastocyanin